MDRKMVFRVVLMMLAMAMFSACATQPEQEAVQAQGLEPGQAIAQVQELEPAQIQEAEPAQEAAQAGVEPGREGEATPAQMAVPVQAAPDQRAAQIRQVERSQRQAGQAPRQYGNEQGFEWETFGDGVMIIGYTGTSRDVRIPQQIQEMPVIGIGNWAFADRRLTGVTIPDSVTFINVQAFYNNQLTSINIPDNVTRIGWGAFMGNQLTSISIGSKVTGIGNWAFENNHLASVTIPDSVTSIGHGAFRRNQLASVTVGANVSLGWHWFQGEMGEHDGRSPSFPQGFDAFYQSQGRRAGTYTYSDGNWSVRPR